MDHGKDRRSRGVHLVERDAANAVPHAGADNYRNGTASVQRHSSPSQFCRWASGREGVDEQRKLLRVTLAVVVRDSRVRLETAEDRRRSSRSCLCWDLRPAVVDDRNPSSPN